MAAKPVYVVKNVQPEPDKIEIRNLPRRYIIKRRVRGKYEVLENPIFFKMAAKLV